MIALFKDRTPVNLLAVIIFALVLKLPLFLYPKAVETTSTEAALFDAVASALKSSGQPAFYSSLLAFILLLLQAFMINFFMNEYRMVSKYTYLPAMAYILITSLLPEWSHFSAPLLANTLIILCFIFLFRLYNQQQSRPRIYNIGLLIGISSFIYFPSAGFILCLLIGILILKPFRLNEMLLLLLGIMTPYYFYAAYLFLSDRFSLDLLFPEITVSVPDVKSSIYLAISTFLLGIPFLIGGFFVQRQLHRILIQVRKNWSILLLYLLLAFFVPFVNSYSSFSTWVLLAAPFAAFHAAAYFYPNRNWLPLFLFFATTGYILYQQYATKLWQ